MKIDPKYRAVAFDMDGTLLDTDIDYEKLGNAEYDTLIGLGVPHERINTHESDHDMILHGMQYLNENGHDISFEELCGLVNRRACDVEMESIGSAVAFKGSQPLLRELKESGYPLGLLTRGQRAYAEKAMERCGLIGYIDAIEAYDDHPTGEQKPNPIAMEHMARRLGVRPEEILYIGDSLSDYRCARDAGSGFIGISKGEAGKKKWEHEKDVVLINSVDDLV